jgi:hypothetical protein
MAMLNFDKFTTVGKFEVRICTGEQTGYFEHATLGDEMGGGLWFENNSLTDYDGTTHLPDSVADGIRVLGFTVPSEFENNKPSQEC